MTELFFTALETEWKPCIAFANGVVSRLHMEKMGRVKKVLESYLDIYLKANSACVVGLCVLGFRPMHGAYLEYTLL